MDPNSKSDLKNEIRTLKADIAEAVRAKDGAKLKKLRRRVKHLKSRTRKLAASAKRSAPAAPVAPATPTA